MEKTNTDLTPSEIAAKKIANRAKAEERANRYKIRDNN